MVEQHHSCFLALEPVTGVARRARCYAFAVALLAQSVEHFHGKEKVVGSIPTEGSLCFSGGGGPPPFAGAGFGTRRGCGATPAADLTGAGWMCAVSNGVIGLGSGDVVSPGSCAGLGPRVRVRLAA